MNARNKTFLAVCYVLNFLFFAVSFFIVQEFGPDKTPMLSGFVVSSWLGTFLLHWKCAHLNDARRLHQNERHDVADQSRLLEQEIAFYEQKKNDLARRASQRRTLSEAARGLGSLLDPTAIQKKLIEIAALMFPSQKVEISTGQNQDAADIYVAHRRQSVLVPSDAVKGTPLIAVPISAQRAVVGVLRVGGQAAYTRDDLRLLESLASLASLAMDNCVLFHQVQQSALRDNLTGLITHKAFQDQFEASILEASRYHQKLSIIVADIDHFKSINDTYGHQAGDQVLQGFAHVMDRNVRPVDIIARTGGEEFCILLLQTDHREAAQIAEQIRQDLMQQFFYVGSKSIAITGSFGVATFPDEATSGQQLMREADQRLYKAKSSGRNNVQSRAA